MGRHERMKRGTGMKDRDDRIADVFDIIKPTVPFKLAKHETLRKRNWSDSSWNSLVKTDVSRCECKKINLIIFFSFIIRSKERAKENTYNWVSV